MKRPNTPLFAIAVAFAVTAPMIAGFARTPTPPPSLDGAVKQAVAEDVAMFCGSNAQIPAEGYTPATTNDPDAKVPVLLWHKIVESGKPDHEVTRPELFKAQLKYLKDAGYNTITMRQLQDYMGGKIKLPKKSVAITFDDGWKDNLEAAKLLDEMGMSATFFIISGAFQDTNYLSVEEVQKLSENPRFEIGSHSQTHFVKYEADLTKLDTCTMAREMSLSKHILEAVVKKPVTSFAWPYGYSTDEGVHIAGKLGYKATGLVNSISSNLPGQNPLFTARLNVDGACSLDNFKKMVETGNLKECTPR